MGDSTGRAVLLTVLTAVFVSACASTGSAPAGAPPNDAAPDATATPAADGTDPMLDSIAVADPVEPSDWRFNVAIYGWLAGVSGTIVTDGQRDALKVPFSTFSDLAEGGFQLYTKARWKDWFVAFDGTWATLGTQSDGALLDVDVKIRQELFDLRLGYAVLNENLEDVPAREGEMAPRLAIVDLYVGARYFRTDITVDLIPVIGPKTTLNDLDERWDPFFGIDALYGLTRRWFLAGRADIGGFGIGGAAHLAWQLEAEAGYRISNLISVFAGYRAIYFDTVTGSGSDGAGADLLQHGPVLGIGFTF